MEWTRGPAIGRGSTGTVSLATTPGGKVFAVKSAELGKSYSLQREQSILSLLSSPRVVGYLGCGVTVDECGRKVYNLMMEYVPGGTLLDVVRREGSRMEEPEIRENIRAILEGLAYLHGRRLAHCDVKGQNILMGCDGPVVADLGCAKWVDCPEARIAGTPSHMAPEAARGEAQGMPADVWALGCTVIEMATGLAPWAGLADPVSALYRIGYSEDVPEIPRWLSEEARDFLGKCLNRDAEDRWTVAQLLKHPFVDESSGKRLLVGSFFNSPTSILDAGFWDSMEEETDDRAESMATQTDDESSSSSTRVLSASERIRRLSCGNSPDWTWGGNWINVRGSEVGQSSSSSLEEEAGSSSGKEGTLCFSGDGDQDEYKFSFSKDDSGEGYTHDYESGNSCSIGRCRFPFPPCSKCIGDSMAFCNSTLMLFTVLVIRLMEFVRFKWMNQFETSLFKCECFKFMPLSVQSWASFLRIEIREKFK